MWQLATATPWCLLNSIAVKNAITLGYNGYLARVGLSSDQVGTKQ